VTDKPHVQVEQKTWRDLGPDVFDVVLTGLNEQQAKAVVRGIKDAMQPAEARLTSRIFGLIAGAAILMLFVSAVIWVVAWMMTNLPTR
jgi:uncharacterized membrane protein required for colicin V production